VWLIHQLRALIIAVESEQEDEAFSGRVTQLVRQLTADTEADQKLIAASENTINMSVEMTVWQ